MIGDRLLRSRIDVGVGKLFDLLMEPRIVCCSGQMSEYFLIAIFTMLCGAVAKPVSGQMTHGSMVKIRKDVQLPIIQHAGADRR